MSLLLSSVRSVVRPGQDPSLRYDPFVPQGKEDDRLLGWLLAGACAGRLSISGPLPRFL